MLFFGHIGITLGVAKACDTSLSTASRESTKRSGADSKPAGAASGQPSGFHHWLREGRRRLGAFDYRLVILGSLLPDLIDKPIFLLSGHASLSGRDYAHSLLLNLVLIAGGLVLTRYRKSWLLVLSFSSFMHLVFDRMWTVPVTLLWPLLGPLLPGDRNAFATEVFYGLFAPINFIPEIIGLTILIVFAVRAMKKKAITSFIKEGILD